MSVDLEFSIGPVQAFVAQARRTRDFWGGSYLLSLLTAHAIAGALRAGADDARPVQVLDDPLVQFARGELAEGMPAAGSVPNHFGVSARDAVHAREVAVGAEAALNSAWRRACEAVWRKYVQPAAAHGLATEAIWGRQVCGFWEITWAVGEAAGELLARRKLWRTHWPPEEAGDKCSVMPIYQELSGYARAQARERQDAFWKVVRDTAGALNVQPGERLCAVALVKRLYSSCLRDSVGFELSAAAWPSTVDMAAAPWVRRVMADPLAAGRAGDYVQRVQQVDPSAVAGPSHFSGLRDASGLARLDGKYLHRSMLNNPRETQVDQECRGGLLTALDSVARALGAPGSAVYAPVYYALVMADGDKLGELAREGADGPATVARALARFSAFVRSGPDGLDLATVYAGGDDVLALATVENALQYAEWIQRQYQDAFHAEYCTRATDSADLPTVSAAIAFVQMTVPLTRVLTEVRRLLDEIAKEQNGRNSLAIAVYGRGGIAVQWVSAWQRRGRTISAELNAVAGLMGRDSALGVSVGVAYRIHELLWRLLGARGWRPGGRLQVPDALDLRALVLAEIVASLEKQAATGQDVRDAASTAADAIAELLPITSGVRGQQAPMEICTDALLLARFLAGGGHEEEHA